MNEERILKIERRMLAEIKGEFWSKSREYWSERKENIRVIGRIILERLEGEC